MRRTSDGLPPTNYLRGRVRRRNREKTFVERSVEYTTCPECGSQFTLSFLLNASAMGEEEKGMGGKQIVCPNCKMPLWYNDGGKIEAVVVKLDKPKIGLFGRIRSCFCALLLKLVRKASGYTPSSSN